MARFLSPAQVKITRIINVKKNAKKIFQLEMNSAVHINSSRDVVWEVFSDIRRWTGWCSVCVRADAAQNFTWKPGDALSLKFRMAGVAVPFNVRVDTSAPGENVSWSSSKFSVTALRTFTFHDGGDHTLVTDKKLFSSPVLPLRLFYPRPLIRRMTESFLADLKHECERRTR